MPPSILEAVAAFAVSCNLLDTYPRDGIGSNSMWTTEEHVNLGVTAVYGALKGKGCYARNPLTDAYTQYAFIMSTGFDELGQRYFCYNTATTSYGVFSSKWNDSYEGVQYANLAIANIPGVDMSSGSLGQGISAAVGMAIAAKLTGADYRVYTLLGDGEIQEGQVWEAAMLAAHKKLDNLVVIVDNNNLQIDGAITEVNSPYPIDKKFEAFNFHVINIDGNDFDQIDAAFKEAKTVKGQPTAIIAKTVKGKGVSFMENQAGWHGKAPNDEEYKIAMEDLEKAGEALCQM